MKNHKGQTSVILILLAAIALIFFAAALNWGRVSQIKTMTSTAAVNGASGMISSIASYGESQIQGQLKGRFKYCSTSSIWGAIFTLIIAVVILAVTWGAGAPIAVIMLAAIGAGLAAASLALQVTVAQPGLTSLWNKQQAALPLVDQFLEQGLAGAVQGTVTDQGKITDYFDMNTNGKFKPGSGDMISRFGFYYTERLRALKRLNNTDITAFLNGLSDLQAVLSEGCPNGASSYGNDPHCNPCCVPLTDPATGGKMRPSSCPTDSVPPGCPSPYPYVYDPSYPQYNGGGSVLAQFGVDSEKKPFNKGDAKGNFFPMLWDMSTLSSSRFNPGAGPSDPIYGLKPDKIKYPDNTEAIAYDADGNGTPMCAEDQDSSQGFWWRKGADQYCSTTWPYDQCRACSDSGCETCTPATAADWAQDPADDIVYGLKEFYIWSKKILAQDDEVLKAHLEEWYPQAAVWIGPDCDGTNTDVCQPGGGLLMKYEGTFRAWALILSAWLNSNDADTDPLLAYYHNKGMYLNIQPYYFIRSNAWCVPGDEAAHKPDAGFPPDEAVHIYAGGKWGSLDGIIACQEYDAANGGRFNKCAADLDAYVPPAAGSPPPVAPQLPISCYGLPTDAGGPPAFDACGKAAFQNWLVADAYAIWERDLRWLAVNDAEIDPDKRTLQENDIKALVQCAQDIAPLQCPTTAQPASCDSLPRSFNGAPPAFVAKADDPVAYQKYHDWVTGSAAAAGQWAPALSSRKAFLEGLRTETLASFQASWGGKGALDNFFNGDITDPDPTHKPVSSLVIARQNFKLYLDKLPNFLVYGWQSPKDPANPSAKQYWHLARAEAMIPSKCPATGQCLTDQFMKVETSTHGFLGTTRCYELKNYDGRGLVRVTRWDEDHQGTANFNNQATVWNFHFGKPGAGVGASASGLAACRSMGLVHNTGSFLPADKQMIDGAFMLDMSRANGVPAPCWDTVDQLLSKGVKSTACAEYHGNGDPNNSHMVIKFVSCPWGAFDDNKTLGN